MKEGIIISGVSSFYDVWTNEGTVRCKARGSFRKQGITPVIGDRVLYSDKLYLEEVLPRTSMLVRPPVANADQAILVIAAHTPEPNLPLLDRFLALVCSNGRMDMVEDILRNFVDAYRRSMGVRKAHLVTVSTPPPHLLDQLKALVKEKTGDDVLIETEVDPSLIGGFVFDIDDYLMDASVKRQLELIREQFIERNRRII